MKYTFLLLLLAFSTVTFSQAEKKIVEATEDTEEVPFAIIEEVPVYKGCRENLANESQRKCMSDAITKHILKKFNINVAKDLGLPDGIARISVIFKVGLDGTISGIRARAPKPELEAEAIRVIKLIPKLTKPGYQRGKPVTVPYSLPIVFKIDNTKYLSKKELRKLKKQKKKANQ
ncbi:MAG: energy transducer TonB [Flavobacteriaceae bacterium]|nr:energy transducer TonB [Flavobacteriaceae bacterium]